MKNNKSLLVSILLALTAFAIAVLFRIFSVSDVWTQMFAALTGAIITVIITLLLLQGQTASEETKERNTKVFEERLRIYQEFLHKLCDVVKDMKIEPEEEIELEFQVAYIAMHTGSESISAISDQVREIIVAIKKGESDSNEMLSQLFTIADAFYKELYGKENDYNDDNRNQAIMNFRSIMIAKEDITQYETEQKEAVITSLNGKEDSLNNRALILKNMITPIGSKQWIWRGTTLVHEFYTDISNQSGKYISSKNQIAVDLTPFGNDYLVTVFTRQYNEDDSKRIAETIWGKFTPYNKRHLYQRIPLSTSNEEIVSIMSQLLSDIKDYRDKNFPLK